MEDRSRNLPDIQETARSMQGQALMGVHSASSIDRFLEKVKRLSFFVCDAYLSIQGIHDVLLPSITIVIPVTGRTEALVGTIESLLSARYSGLCISIVGLKDMAKIVEKLPRHPSIKFFEAPSGATVPEAIRPMLLWAPSPIIAWLEPGDTFSSNVLYRVGDIFRGKRAGAVLVPKHESLTEGVPSHAGNLDFGFLSTQNSSFPAKIFVDRERFWAAAKTFAGTNYDCNDWAVALNTARFSRVQLLADGYYQSADSVENFSIGESQKIKARISAQMWWTERLRQSVWRWRVKAFDRLASWRLKCNKRFEQRHPVKGVRMLVPPVFTGDLAGFSSGEAIEFLGTYQWLVATPIARSVYFDRETEVLIFLQPGDSNHNQNGSAPTEVKVSPGEERHTQALAQGTTNLLHGLFEPLRGQLGGHIEASVFSITKPLQAAESFVIGPRTSDQTTEPNALFDLLVMEQPLNTSLRPHAVLRRAANQLKWNGWLVFGCTIFDFQTLNENWSRSASMMQPDHELCFSAKALGDLLQVAGFTPHHVLGLTPSQVEDFAWEATTRAERVHDLAQTLFQTAPENGFKKGGLVILACQRTF
jgi:hypothetical protein